MRFDKDFEKAYRSGVATVILAALLVAAALALGCDRKPDAPAQSRVRAQAVSTVTVEPQRVTLSTELSGRTTAYRIAEIRPRINGLILKRLFVEGSDVKAGQVLYQIDPAPFLAELNSAEASLARAEAQIPSVGAKAARYKELLKARTLSQQDYDDAAAALNELKAEIKSLQASVEVARINLGYTKITAPISGRIGKSSVTDGAIVTAYQTTALATIQQLDPIYVDVPQSTTELLRIKTRLQKGQLDRDEAEHNRVGLILEDGQPYAHEGNLQFSDVTVDQTTGSVILRAVFPNPDGTLLPGMFVKAVVPEGVDDNGILIPQQAVSRDHQGNPFAMIVDGESKAQRRPLTLDRAIGDKWLVLSGLAPGDTLIVEGLQMLRSGAPVQATPYVAKEADQSRNSGAGGE
ncbi:MAG: efflux RND transporter periplasmic adaptor subunit [Desulfovibrionaceae bacterium]|jgi:membrane fusion protein (multidrug efflux system)|nr:efflux RND transporter periplasmic adaptor subunit [Desulfovibrionaceae bacterium]